MPIVRFGDLRQCVRVFQARQAEFSLASTAIKPSQEHRVAMRRLSLAAAAVLGLTAAMGGFTSLAQQPSAGVSANAALATAAHTLACGAAGSTGAVTMRTSEAKGLALCEGRALSASGAAGPGQPLALASSDFDEDGVPDLVSAFAAGSNGGTITVHRGNVAALWPYGAALRNGPPAAFLPNARSFSVPETPTFVASGDFDADGHADIVTARKGSDAVYFLRGDGRGGFLAARRVSVAGVVTALISGEMNRPDGLPDLVIGVTVGKNAKALVYESPRGAIQAQPESFVVGGPITSLAIGKFSGSAMHDLAVAAGDVLTVVHGRDRKLSQSLQEQSRVKAATTSTQRVGYAIQALTAGDFTGGGPSLAALGQDGEVHILEHTVTDSSLLGKLLEDENYVPSFQARTTRKDDQAKATAGRITPGQAARFAAIREQAKSAGSGEEWEERSSIVLPSGFRQSTPMLISGRVSGSQQEDLLIADSGNRQLHVLSVPKASHTTGMAEQATRPRMRMLASLEATEAPAAVLPMRLSRHGLQGLVVLHAGQSVPTVMPQDVPAANVFTVTNTSDKVIPVGQTTQFTGPEGSLRAAIYNANSAGGPSEIIFNIPTTDPGYDSATGTFLIQPLSQSVPNSDDNNALGSIYDTTTIDGYTQPGASPNTSATSDNAKILIRIDGGKATTPGGSGLVPFEDVGSVFRGFVFTGWINPAINGDTASGASGIEAAGVGDYIEGNFFGTNAAGTSRTDSKGNSTSNRIGIFADDGPGTGTTSGNIIGGTTPQARNILSNNQVGGVLFLSIAYESHLEGNFIGVDASGAKALGNNGDGAGANGPTIVIGGTLPGDGNVISANGTDVDFNDITGGGVASNSTVQGNLIGTDSTGTTSVSKGVGTGVSIYQGPTAELVGGTSPAARNVISGNYYGVYIFNSVTNSLVQGNYIGTDVTGTKAVGNNQQGFIQGLTDSNSIAAISTTLGGSVAGAGNLISGNTLDGVSISGAAGGEDEPLEGSTVMGNSIGTDVTGTKALGNGGAGVIFLADATNNTVGGSGPGMGNIIANNKGDGVHIDPQPTNGGTGNVTVGNMIQANGGAGVRVVSGTSDRISQNSIYQNKALGIDIGTSGPNTNSNCNADNSGPNGLQNYPVLTAGSGKTFISATATDPNGNTSEFSKTVAGSMSGNMLDLLGSFNGTANTNFTIEFFSNTVADGSGYGQGQTYLGSTQVTTGSDCTIAINNPVNTANADVSIALSENSYQLVVGPDFGSEVYTAKVQNLGPATATNVVVTDTLPSSETVSSLYCNTGPCQSAVTTSFGNCTVSGQTVKCSLGTLAAGQTATVNIPVQVLGAGSIVNKASVTATQTDPVLANNTSSVTKTSTYPDPFIDATNSGVPNISPDAVVAGSPDTLVTIYGGFGFLPSSKVSLNGTNLQVVSFVDNQICGNFDTYYCAAIEVNVPASLMKTAGTPTLSVSNPDPGEDGGPNEPSIATFNIVSSCSFTVGQFSDLTDGSPLDPNGTDPIQEQVGVVANAAGCNWKGSSNVGWVVPLESAPVTTSYTQYGGTLNTEMDFAVAPNSSSTARNGSVTIAGQTFSFTQPGGASCDYKLSSSAGNFTNAGGAGSFNVTTDVVQKGALCSPSVQTNFPGQDSGIQPYPTFWITVSLGYVPENGTVTFNVAPNTGPARTGTIMVGGYVYTVSQAGAPCSYVLTPDTALWGAGGGSGSFGVAASGSSCAWTAKSSDTSLLAVSSGASGTGNGTVKYTVKPNNDGPKTPKITVADTKGGSSVFTVTQAADYSCTFTISPTPKHVGSEGTSDYFLLTASQNYCKWTATSSNPSALSVQGNSSSGGGTQTVYPIYYAVGQNTSTQARVLTITAGCEIFTINQDGTAASNPAPTITALQPTGATAGGAAFTLTVNGTGFISGSTVSFNGKAEATRYVSATQLTAAISAAEIAAAATVPVVVTNPAPGGGASNTVNFAITSAGTPTASLNPTSLAFPNTAAASKSAAQNVTLTNTGSASLAISGISVTGTNAADFTETNTCGTSLAAGAKCTIAVIFAPASAASFSATLSVADNASGSPQTVALTGTGTSTAPVAGFSPTALTFSTPAGTPSASQSVTLQNTGASALTISGVALSGSGASTFSTTNTCGNSLAVNAQCTIAVVFSPKSTGNYTATLSVTDNATGSPQMVSLTGTATTGPEPAVSLTPASLTFTSVTGTASAAQSVTLKNTGSASLTISGITLTGSGASVFAQTNTCGSSLAAGASCAISVKFTPSSAASFSAMISVADNTTGSPQTVTLTGTGTAAAAPAASLTPSSLTFTSVTGTASAAQSATLKNTGTASLTISGITLTGSGAAAFAQTNTCGSTLAAGASCAISVKFTPSSAASFSAMISVADNATGSPQTVTLTGTGTAAAAPAASLTPTSLTFTSVTGIASAAQSATLKNTGGAVLTISGITLTGSGAAVFAQTNTCGSSLAAGASCAVSVIFTPSSAAGFTATVSVADNATGSPQTVTLSGTGTAPAAPAATVTPSLLTFSAQTGSTAAAQTVTLKNTGGAAMAISGITLTGDGSADYAETTTCGSSLNAGASCTIAVTFTPTATGSFSAGLSIADNAPGSPQAVTLTGTGTAAPPPTFSLSTTSTSQTVQPGGAAQYSVSVAAKNGAYPNAVTLSATGLPTGATATFNPASVMPGSSSASSTLTVQTAATTTTTAGTTTHGLLALASLPGFSLLFFAVRRRKRWLTMVILLAASIGATVLSGCGGGFALSNSSGGLGPKTYNVTVTGTSGSDTASTTVQLIVQ